MTHYLLFKVLPVDVEIVTKKSELVAGRQVELRCETHGSKPAALVKWYRNGEPLNHSM